MARVFPGMQEPPSSTTRRAATSALALLLAINLFNYIDRYILAAVEPEICKDLLGAATPANLAKMGTLATAFIVSYMIASGGSLQFLLRAAQDQRQAVTQGGTFGPVYKRFGYPIPLKVAP